MIRRLCVCLTTLWLCVVFFIVPVFAQGSVDKADELFFVSQKAFDDGFYDVALRYLEEFRSRFPNSSKSSSAKLLTGQCYFFKSQYLKAYDVFHDVLQSGQLRDAALFWMGETYFKGSDFAQARTYYSDVLKEFPDSEYVPQALYALGWAYYEQGDQKEALTEFERLLEEFPSHELVEDALFRAGDCALSLGDYHRAAGYLRRYLEGAYDDQDQAQAMFFLAEALYYDKNYLESVTYYARAADRSQDIEIISLARIGMGWSYYHLKKYDLALNAFNWVIDSEGIETGTLQDAFIGKASVLEGNNDSLQALAVYNEFLEKFSDSPRRVEVRLKSAALLMGQGSAAEAEAVYKNVLASLAAKDHVTEDVWEAAYNGLAWALLKQGKVEEAVTAFRETLRKATNAQVRANTLVQIGDAFQESDMYGKALGAYDQVLKEYPDSVFVDYAQFQQGITLLKAKDLDNAIASLQVMLTNFSESKYIAETHYYLGLAYFQLKDWQVAIDHIKSFRTLSKTSSLFDAQADYIVAMSLFSQDQFEQALDAFKRLRQTTRDDQDWLARTADLYIAKSLYAMKHTKEAVKRLQALMNKYQGSDVHEEALLYLAEVNFNEGRLDKAVQYYQEALTMFPGSDRHSAVLFDLGQIYELQEKWDLAVSSYDKINPKDKGLYAKARLAIAGVLSRTMDQQTALETYRKVADDIPNYRRDAFMKIARLYEQEYDYQRALEMYEKALSAQPVQSQVQNDEILFRIAEMFELMKRWDQAVEQYFKVAYLSDKHSVWSVKAYLRAARIFADREQWTEAASAYKKVADMDIAESKYAQEQLELIQEHKH